MTGFDFDEGYDTADVKHSGWAEGMRERADTERKRTRYVDAIALKDELVAEMEEEFTLMVLDGESGGAQSARAQVSQPATARVIVCGSRKWHDRRAIADRLNELVLERGWRFPDPVIVHGAARGADRLAEEEAGKSGLLTEAHPANWDLHGKSAGLIRNLAMANLGAELCLAFWDGQSTGTAHMVAECRKRGIPVEVVRPSSATAAVAASEEGS